MGYWELFDKKLKSTLQVIFGDFGKLTASIKNKYDPESERLILKNIKYPNCLKKYELQKSGPSEVRMHPFKYAILKGM